MMVIDNKYEMWQVVYLITDQEQKERIVCQMIFDTGLMYRLMCGTESSVHYEAEISSTKKL